MKRSEKENLVSDLKDVFSSFDTVAVVHYKGLTVSDLEGLRNKAFESDIGFRVVKNTLASIAAEDTKNSVLKDLFKGPVAIAWGEDPVACTKLVQEFSEKNPKMMVVGGSYNGGVLSAEEVKALSKLPSLDELRSKLVGLMVASATKLAILSKTPASNVVGVLKSYSEKK